MSFTHPLAKKAKIWPMTSLDGAERRVLVVVTTLELAPENGKYKKKLVERLTAAASSYLEANGGVTDFILINRMKDWDE
jgi:hypothetical protein